MVKLGHTAVTQRAMLGAHRLLNDTRVTELAEVERMTFRQIHYHLQPFSSHRLLSVNSAHLYYRPYYPTARIWPIFPETWGPCSTVSIHAKATTMPTSANWVLPHSEWPLSSPRQTPRLFQVFSTKVSISIKLSEVYKKTCLRVHLSEYCCTIGSPSNACQLYLTVLRLCLLCDYRTGKPQLPWSW